MGDYWDDFERDCGAAVSTKEPPPLTDLESADKEDEAPPPLAESDSDTDGMHGILTKAGH